MKTTSKRVISLLLAIMMVLSIFTIVPMTASAEETTATVVTAKALYKSHKIEWSSTGKEDTSAFTITDGEGKTIVATTTYVDVTVNDQEARYYTALVSVGTGKDAGTTYTVKNGETEVGTATVTEKTGEAALFHNAIVAENYGSAGKEFAGTTDQLIDLTAGDPVKLAKLKNLEEGAIFAGAKTKDNTKAQAIVGSNNNGSSLKIVNGYVTGTVKNNLNASYSNGSSGKVTNNENFVAALTVLKNYRIWMRLQKPNNVGSTGFWTRSGTAGFFKDNLTTTLYLGGQNLEGGYQPFNGTIYYVIVSEETFGSPSNASDAGDPASFRTLTQNNTPGSASTVAGVSLLTNDTNNVITWNGGNISDTQHYQIFKDGVEITPTSFTATQQSNGTYLYTVTVDKEIGCEYTVANYLSNTSAKVTAVESKVSAKALYKSHKVEWTDTTDTTADNFTVTSTYGDISSAITTTYVDVNGVRNYTALVTVGTGVKAGTVYTVAKGETTVGSAVVYDNTSFESLKKNAVLVKDYTTTDTGYQTFNGTGEKVEVDDVQLAKLQYMKYGAILISANYTDVNKAASQAVISLGADRWYGMRNNVFGGKLNEWLMGGTGNKTNGIHNIAISYSKVAYDGGKNEGFYVSTDNNSAAGAKYTGGALTGAISNKKATGQPDTNITKDSVYIGAMSGNTTPFYGDVYYAIVSEESYTNEELVAFTSMHINKFNAFNSQIAELEKNLPQVTNDTFSVIDNDKYQTLRNTLETLKSYKSTNKSDKELDSALDTINSQFASLDYKGNVVPVSNYILNANASANTYANNGTTDGNVSFLFDGNKKIDGNLTLWHTFYKDSGGQGHAGVTANNPAALQLGFGDVIKLKQVVCTPRAEYSNEIANYTLYVSTADTMPALTADISTKAELDSIINDSTKGWKQVKTGTLAKVIAGNQIITLDKAEDAKWMLLVMTSASETNNGGFQYIALSSMSIYRENSNITKLDNDTLKAKASVNTRPGTANGSLAWGTDGGSDCLFDNNSNTLWHSNYSDKQSTAGIGTTAVNAETPACVQLGFENAVNLKKFVCYPRSSFADEMKSYEIYISNAETVDNLTGDMKSKDSLTNGWTLVKRGTVDAVTTANVGQEIVLDAPVSAKWVRIVVTETQRNDGSKLFFAMSGMEVYVEDKAVLNTSTNFANDSAKWNNTAERVAILAKNATANVQETNHGLEFMFNGNYALNVSEGEFYGSWQTKEEDRREPWIQTNFGGESVCVSGIVIFDRLLDSNGTKTAQHCFNSYEVLLSNDANFENYIVAASGQRTDKSYSTNGYAIKFDQPYDCKYIKFVTHGSVDCKIVEMDIYEYVGMKSKTTTTVTVNTDACTVATDKLLNTVDFNFNKMFANGFTKAEIQKQILDIELSDISHNYQIVVGDDAQVSIVATDATYTLTVGVEGTANIVDTKNYGENFNYTVDNAKGWEIDGKIIANGNTFNFKATDNITVTAITDTVSTDVSVYIPAPVVGFDGTKTTVQIPVYVNGTTPDKKGIVLVNTDDVEAIKTAIKDGTSTANVKISKADSATLSNKGRYIHTIKANGKLTTGTFYAYVIDGDNNVTLSNAQVIG